MGILKFTAIYLGTVAISFPLMVWGAVSTAEWYLESKIEANQVGPDGSVVYIENHEVRTGRTMVVTPDPSAQPSATPDSNIPKVSVKKTKTKKRVVRRKARGSGSTFQGTYYDNSDYGPNPNKRPRKKPHKPSFGDLMDPPETGLSGLE